MTKTIPDSVRYSNRDLLSYNAFINFIVGTRGNGKTFDFKVWAIKDFLKKGKQFFWMRRYATELEDIETFFDDIAFKFPDLELKVGGGKFYVNKEIAGYYLPLSKQMTKKSVPYPKVDKLIFDEFLIEKSNYHYLRNEVNLFLNIVNTISRGRDDFRCFLIANSTSQINPYFAYWGILLKNERFTRVNSEIIVEKADTPAYQEAFNQTRLGKVIKDTDYGKYAVGNEFINDSYEFIEKKSENARNIFNIVFKENTIGIWSDIRAGKLYCSFKHNKDMPNYCFTIENMKPNYLMLTMKSNNLKVLKNAFNYGCIYYESFKVRAIMDEAISYLNIH